MGLISNRVDKESLKPGDHIYSWRTAYIYAHHGIYIGDEKVIHFTRRGQEVGTGTVIDFLLVSSGPSPTQIPCTTCGPPKDDHGVVISCLNCFLAGGILYRFEYSVSPAHFLAKARGGTCTLAASDPPEVVVDRAKYLLEYGFGCYNVFKNNCEDFAIYCKTGLFVLDQGALGQGGQVHSIIGGVVSIIGGPLATALAKPLWLMTKNLYGMAGMAGMAGIVGMTGIAGAAASYCANRYVADIGSGLRSDVVKISAEDLTRRLSTGLLQVIEPPRALSTVS